MLLGPGESCQTPGGGGAAPISNLSPTCSLVSKTHHAGPNLWYLRTLGKNPADSRSRSGTSLVDSGKKSTHQCRGHRFDPRPGKTPPAVIKQSWCT